MAAKKLRRLEGSPGRSWRSDAATRLEAISSAWEDEAAADLLGTHLVALEESDASLLDQVAFELIGEENPRALELDSTTWQTQAAHELADLAVRLRTA